MFNVLQSTVQLPVHVSTDMCAPVITCTLCVAPWYYYVPLVQGQDSHCSSLFLTQGYLPMAWLQENDDDDFEGFRM